MLRIRSNPAVFKKSLDEPLDIIRSPSHSHRIGSHVFFSLRPIFLNRSSSVVKNKKVPYVYFQVNSNMILTVCQLIQLINIKLRVDHIDIVLCNIPVRNTYLS
jgi:hypothetical protein